MRQAPVTHAAAEALVMAQARPHCPQLAVVVRRSVSQPLRGFESQLPQFVSHVGWHALSAHAVVP